MKSDIYYNYNYNNILDSRLITPTKKRYCIKLIRAGNYIQLYYYPIELFKKIDSDKQFRKNLKIYNLAPIYKNLKDNSIDSDYSLSESIELKNIIRSKNSCQLLAKANINSWHSFITLTYKDNYTDLKSSRKHFSYFIDSIRRVYKDFKYICITEFQKRGAIHYHLLTNLDKNSNLLYLQDNKFYHIKYWSYGFNSVEFITGNYKKIIGYISKYMTKDIDNRLFGYRRYLYSRNLTKPIIDYIDLSDIKIKTKFLTLIHPYNTLEFSNEYHYINSVEPIIFQELSKE